MKIIAYFLPQYHEIEENNRWWGKGFTEWSNLRKAKKLYKKHYQPIEPYKDNYYNLLEKKTMIWQTELAKKYGVYGFCYYHYWFNGRKVLEKPIENLLKWKEIPQKYCFCWANHSWKKTWNGLNEILIKQTYGGEEEWREHLEYLLPFFKDDRYIKIENKPVFLIFSPNEIKEFDKMIDYFNTYCFKNGFDGIYIIESKKSLDEIQITSKKSSGIVIREPDFSRKKRSLFHKVLIKLKTNFSKNYLYFVHRDKYSKFIKWSLEYSKSLTNYNIFPGIFTGWDNTIRHGRRGHVIEGGTPELFREYLRSQKKIMKEKKCEYIFLNAWNEWAEGMYLEPDKKNKYKYLEVIKEVLETKE